MLLAIRKSIGNHAEKRKTERNKNMLNITLVGEAVASAIKGSKKFATEEHKAALAIIAKESDPADLVENISRIANVSAIRQELEKGGILQAATSDTAFVRAVKAGLAALP